MARIEYDPGIRAIRGGVGGFVYRKQKDGSAIVSRRPPTNPDRVPTEAQAQQLQRFREASARCRNLMEDMAVKQVYQQIAAERGSSKRLWALMMGDVLKPPETPTIDLSQYTGAVGSVIRILAQDNVGISRLKLAIHDTTAMQVLESAEKVMTENMGVTVEWLYTTTVMLPDESLNHHVDIEVAAYDLAGNEITSQASVR